MLDLGGFKYGASETVKFSENAQKTSGTLTVTDGSLSAKITLFGQYVVGGFHLASDGAGGTNVTYSPPTSHFTLAAGGHG